MEQSDAQVCATLTSVLLDNANLAVAAATKLEATAGGERDMANRSGASLTYAKAQLKMLNAVVSTNIAVVTKLDELCALLMEVAADE